MKPLTWDAINPITGKKFAWDDKNLRWGSPSTYLEPGDAGFVPYPEQNQPPPKPTKTKHRIYMASNPTPDSINELLAAGEDLCDGLDHHGVAAGILQNTAAATRADLDTLVAAFTAFKQAESAQVPAYAAHRSADSNAKGFIAKAINVLKNYLGNRWSDAWLATGLPNQSVSIPRTQDERFSALTGLKGYFTNHAAHENATLGVTAAIATTLHTALSGARNGVGNALNATKAAKIAFENAKDAFRARYRGTIGELEQKLDAEDPRWYDFGLNRPADAATPGQPSNVVVSAAGPGALLVVIDGARRANSFNYYRKIIGTDTEPVKATNTEGTQYTLTGLPTGATVEVTVTGVNDAGEGPASAPVSVVVG